MIRRQKIGSRRLYACEGHAPIKDAAAIPCFLFLLLISHFSFLIPPSLAETPQTIKVGVIGTETGEDAETGLITLAGAELAAKELNDASGIDGMNIEIIHYDNKSNAQITQAAVQKMINERVVAIIASPTGWSTFAPTWMANEARVIFMSAGSKRHIARSGQFIFRNSLADETATEEIIKYAADKLGYKNYAIITSMRDDETSLSIGGLYRKAVMNKGGKVVSETHIFMDKTMEEAISQLKKDAKTKIDAVIFAGDDVVALDILKELRKQGIKSHLV
ncbi:MAG: ABC transporter substrate-binding protein, partial [Deltaproteobacteria bacterium]|nr:ABC transporter substrate-binding protein [Deltaproteobacteria bacterium]